MIMDKLRDYIPYNDLIEALPMIIQENIVYFESRI